MGGKRRKKDLLQIQEAILKYTATQTEDAFEALKALVWAAQDMAEITIRQRIAKMGDQPATFIGSRMMSREELEKLKPEDLLRFVVEFGIDIRNKTASN